MSKRPAKRTKESHSSATSEKVAVRPALKKAWIIITAVVGVLCAVLLNGPTILENARKLPKSIEQTRTQYLSWLHDDSEWTGNWSSFPDGIVDMEDMHLSNVDLQITIWSSQGKIDGAIATKKICSAIPSFDFILLKGNVSGHTAQVIAWDTIGGHDVDFARLELKRNGDIMTVTPLEGAKNWFPAMARLGRLPRANNEEPEPQSGFCAEERQAIMKQTIEQLESKT